MPDRLWYLPRRRPVGVLLAVAALGGAAMAQTRAPAWQRQSGPGGHYSYAAPVDRAAGVSGSLVNSVVQYGGDATHRYSVVVHTGPLFTPAWWRTQWAPGTAMTARTVRVCGVDAELVTHQPTGETATPGALAVPRTYLALFVATPRVTFFAEWIVATADRASFATDEARFFDSFRCP